MKWLKEHMKRYGIRAGTVMLAAKLLYALFCRPFYAVLFLFYRQSDPKRILFESKPDFSDNARALYEYMLRVGLNEAYQITWLVEDPSAYRKYAAKNVCFIKREGKYSGCYTMQANIHAWKAGWVFFTHSIYQLKHRSKGQQLINLWHGCGYKAAKGESTNIAFDRLLVPSELFVKTKQAFFGRERKAFLPIGYPRYDMLLKGSKEAQRVLDGLKQECGAKKAIIWMPTFRRCENSRFSDDTLENENQLPLISGKEDFERLDAVCKKAGILLLIKYHEMQLGGIHAGMQGNSRVIDNAWLEENGLQLYELLSGMDALITDYSSVAVDFILADKPIAYILSDYEDYRKSRGFVFDDPLSYMPGSHVYTLAELEGFLEGIGRGEDEAKEQRRQLLPLLHNPCACYCERVLSALGISG